MQLGQSVQGTYILVKHGTFETDGSYKATSDYINGELYYGADGAVHVLIVFSQTPTIPSHIFGYVGTYEIKSPDTVNHRMTVATVPSQVGTTEYRKFEIRERELILSRTWDDGRSLEAVWRRK